MIEQEETTSKKISRLQFSVDDILCVVETVDGKTMTVVYRNGFKEIVPLASGMELSRMLNREQKAKNDFNKRHGVDDREILAPHRGMTYKGPIIK